MTNIDFILFGLLAGLYAYLIYINFTFLCVILMFLIYLIFFIIFYSLGLSAFSLLFLLIYVGSTIILFCFICFFLETNKSFELLNPNKFALTIITIFSLFIFIIFFNFFLFFSTNFSVKDIFYFMSFDDPQTKLKLLNDSFFTQEVLPEIFFFFKSTSDWTVFNFVSCFMWKLGSIMYTIYFFHVFIIGILLFISVMGVVIITSDYKDVSQFDCNLVFFNSFNLFFFVKNGLFTSNNYLENNLTFISYNLLPLIGFFLFFFLTVLILFSKKINFIKLIFIFELYFLSIISLLIYFSYIHSNYEGFILIIFSFGLFAAETAVGFSLFSYKKGNKVNFK